MAHSRLGGCFAWFVLFGSVVVGFVCVFGARPVLVLCSLGGVRGGALGGVPCPLQVFF